jgi:hypothetical protein
MYAQQPMYGQQAVYGYAQQPVYGYAQQPVYVQQSQSTNTALAVGGGFLAGAVVADMFND